MVDLGSKITMAQLRRFFEEEYAKAKRYERALRELEEYFQQHGCSVNEMVIVRKALAFQQFVSTVGEEREP
jgi:hypothetical protein